MNRNVIVLRIGLTAETRAAIALRSYIASLKNAGFIRKVLSRLLMRIMTVARGV